MAEHKGHKYAAWHATTRELVICPCADFSFVQGIFALSKNALICTGSSHRLVQMSPHRAASSPPPPHPV